MRDRAQVASMEALRRFRGHLAKFVEDGRRALTEAEADVQRTQVWLDSEQQGNWKREMRKRQERVSMCKNELYRAQITSADERPDAIDEKRALEKAERALREAEHKMEASKVWSRRLQKEMVLYKGQCQALGNALYGELPRALLLLEKLSTSLDDYLKVAAPDAEKLMSGVDLSLVGGSLNTSDFGSWRLRAPDTATRAITLVPQKTPHVEVDESAKLFDHRAFRALELQTDPPDGGDKVVLDPGCLTGRRIVLIRGNPAHEGDSGWYIGARKDGQRPSDLDALTVHTVRSRRPDLHELLDLPLGWMVLMDGSRIESVLGPDDVDVLDTENQR